MKNQCLREAPKPEERIHRTTGIYAIQHPVNCVLVLLGSLGLLFSQSSFKIVPGTEYVLKVPSDQKHWILLDDPLQVNTCYLNRATYRLETDFHFSERPPYETNTVARVVEISSEDKDAVRVVLANGNSGWVPRVLIEMTKAQQRDFDIKQAAIAKEVAAQRLLDEQRRLLDEQRRLKEQAFIAGLPILWPSSSRGDVLVATSLDCEHDREKVMAFGAKNGTGVEFRKKILELITLHCADWMPTGTAIEVIHRQMRIPAKAITIPN